MNKGLIVATKASQTIPDGAIIKILGEYTTGFGFATVAENESGDGMHVETLFVSSAEYPYEETLRQILADCMDQRTLFYFVQNDALLEEDQQPFEVIKEDDQTMVVVALEGDFSQFEQEGSAHTNAYHALKEFVDSEIKLRVEQCGGDVAKLSTLLEAPGTRNSWRSVLLPKGAAAVLDSDGQIVTFSAKGAEVQEYDWGWTSKNLLAASPVVKEEPKVETTAKLSLKDRILGAKKAPPVVASTTPVTSTAPVKEVAPIVTATEKKAVESVTFPPLLLRSMAPAGKPQVNAEGIRYFYPPPEYHNQKALKKFYNNNMGTLPKDIMSRPPISENQLMTGSPIRQLLTQFPSFQAMGNAVKTGEAKLTTVERKPDPVSEVVHPVVSADNAKMIVDYLKDVKMIEDDEHLKNRTAKHGKATPFFGMENGITDAIRIPFTNIYHIFMKYPKESACLFMEAMEYIAALDPDAVKKEVKEPVQVTEKSPVLTPKQRIENMKKAKLAAA